MTKGVVDMKREKFLWPLTAGHHEALMAAGEIRRCMEIIRNDGAMGAWAGLSEGARTFFQNSLEPHFKAEEAMVALFDRHAGADNPASQKMRSDHRALRSLFKKNSVDSLLLFAEGLEEHIRFEEEKLFPLLQSQLNNKEKQQVAALLEKKLLPALPQNTLQKK